MATKPKTASHSKTGTRKRTPARAKAKAKPKRYTAGQTAAYNYAKQHYAFPASNSKAGQASYNQWVKAHPFPASSGTTTATKPRGATPLLGQMVSEYGWVRGLNEEYPTCVATAIANSLLTVRGIRATDDQVMRLHYHAGAMSGDGVSIADALASVMECGLAGIKPVAYFAVVREPSFGTILGMTDGVNDHAVTVTSSGLISWGAPLSDELAESWMLDGEAWHVQW